MAKAQCIAETVASWLVVVLLSALVAALEKVPPYQHYVLKQNLYKYAYPLKPNTIPIWSVLVYSLFGPWVIILISVIFEGFKSRSTIQHFWKEKGSYVHTMTLSLWMCVLITGAITSCIKNPMGALRPNFVERCWPNGVIKFKETRTYLGSYNMDGGIPDCTGPKHLWQEGMRSFLSGHSSISMAGLGFLGFYIWHRLHAFSGNTNVWRLVAGLLPFALAVMVGVTRIMDYWHHWQDVVAGLLLGLVMAALSYYHFYFKVQSARDARKAAIQRHMHAQHSNGNAEPMGHPEADFRTHNASVIFDRSNV